MDLFVLHAVQRDSGAIQALIQWVSLVLIPVKGGRGMKLTHSLQLSAEDESEWICTSANMVSAHGICRDNLILLMHSKLFSSK